jgi:hypothetical protein
MSKKTLTSESIITSAQGSHQCHVEQINVDTQTDNIRSNVNKHFLFFHNKIRFISSLQMHLVFL